MELITVLTRGESHIALFRDEDWDIALRLDPQEGRLVVSELRVAAATSLTEKQLSAMFTGLAKEANIPPGGVTTTLLRRLKVPELLDEFRLRRELTTLSFIGREGNATLVAGDSGAGRGYSDSFYAEFAAAYLRLVAAGERRPAVILGDQLGLSTRSVQSRLATARRLGLLTGESGKAGGELTEKARRLLPKSPGGK